MFMTEQEIEFFEKYLPFWHAEFSAEELSETAITKMAYPGTSPPGDLHGCEEKDTQLNCDECEEMFMRYNKAFGEISPEKRDHEFHKANYFMMSHFREEHAEVLYQKKRQHTINRAWKKRTEPDEDM